MKLSNQRIAAGFLAAASVLGTLASCGSDSNWNETDGEPASIVHEGETASETAEADMGNTSPAADFPWEESKHRLQFDENGEFKILVFSDIHINGTMSALAENNMKVLVEREEPDLVMFDGDNTWGLTTEAAVKKAVGSMVDLLEEKKIPWGHVYGNHDCEGSNLKKEKQQAVYESFDYCVSQAGPEELYGQGNYVLPVYGSDGEKVLFNVWALDSGEYLSAAEKAAYLPVGGTFQGHINSSYDYIQPSQIRWYMDTSEKMEAYNGDVVPGVMFFHIPLQEFYNAWVNRDALNYTGERREVVCASEVNSGLYTAMVERGDIKAVTSGHDHRNDYMVEYGGIKLCYCSTISETGYCDYDMFGGRVFVVKESDPSDVQTYMSYVDEARMGMETAVIDADPIPEGVILDFDSYEPELDWCGWANDTSSAAEVDKIIVEIADDRGLDGTKALAVSRKNYSSSNTGNNAEVRMALETPGLLGDSKYIRVWMDLTGDSTEVDFRKAAFGVVVNNVGHIPYNTDEKDTPSPFWYLPDGGTEWKKMSHGNDGCFGKAEGSSVRGLKGWFAFPVENMLKRGALTQLDEDSCITHVYLYYCLASAEMKANRVYIDNISLVKDYKVFE